MEKEFLIFLSIFLFFEFSQEHPHGGPLSRCISLEPSHQGITTQTTPSPYEIFFQENRVAGGKTIQVEIRSAVPLRTFRGFMMNARVKSNQVDAQIIVGQFQPVVAQDFNFRDCSGPRTTVTNANRLDRNRMVFDWTAPLGFSGHIRFHATVIEFFDIFWVNQISSEIEVIPAEPGDEPTKPTTTLAPPIEGIDIYDGCDVSKTCFGIGSGDCVRNRQCDTIGAVTYHDGRFIFEMRSSKGAAFVAFAVSHDRMMGSDSAIECVKEGDKVAAYASWTRGNPYMDALRIVDSSIISTVYSRFENGVIYCKVEKLANITIESINFNLLEEKYYLLLASGNEVKSNAVAFHDINEDASSQSFLLTEVSVVTGRPRLMLYLHACFMIVSWIGLASIGIFSARFLKITWVGTKVFGKDLWFVIHQLSMGTTWFLTLAGFIIIIVDSTRWTTNPHSVLGTIAFSLCMLQPLGAFFRPGPKDSSRPVFNFLHMSAGNFAHLLAVITIFYAIGMTRAQLPDFFIFVLIAFATFYVVTYILMTVLGIFSSTLYVDNSDEGLMKKQQSDAPFSLVRKTIFYCFAIAICTFVVGLILVVLSS